MRQKFLYLCFIIIIQAMFTQAFAKTIEVQALNDFSTSNPPASLSIKLLEPIELDNNITLMTGSEVSGKITDVVSPKRLKRNAKFSFNPVYYTYDGNTAMLNTKVKAKYAQPKDKGHIAKKAAVSVGNFFFKGLSMGVAAVEGAINNTQENRLKSSAEAVYESSPISYVEKGKDIEIKKMDVFYLNFPENNTKKDSTTHDRSNIK